MAGSFRSRGAKTRAVGALKSATPASVSPPEDIPRLTERFYRVDKSRSRETGGTGLGLAIVKHVLLRHGGYLDVRSEIGRGSTFSAVLPIERLLAQTADTVAVA